MASDKTGGMNRLSKEVVREVDEALLDRELEIIARSSLELAKLKPQISDAESFKKLMEAVDTANGRNESIGEFRNRLQALGSGVMSLAKRVVTLI